MALRIVLLEVVFHLEGCTSLKEKRGRLSGLKDRIGKFRNVAVCESDYQDDHTHAQWAFVVAGSGQMVDKTIANVEEQVEESVDAQVIGINRQDL